MLVVGDPETRDQNVAVRTRDAGNLGAMALDALVERMAEEGAAGE
jgi:threonyl-tRNA synthetase